MMRIRFLRERNMHPQAPRMFIYFRAQMHPIALTIWLGREGFTFVLMSGSTHATT